MPNPNRDAFGANYIDPSTIGASEPWMQGAWRKYLAVSSQDPQHLRYSSFSGTDIKAAIWIPPSKDNGQRGTYRLWAELQTVTISSERPAGPVRCLGQAAVRDYVRGVRTIAGTLIFTVLDYDVFADVYQKSDKESPASHPIFVDQIPPFHIILTANTEIGASASLAIIDCTIVNTGQTFSVDDLLLESTYSYVAKYVTPFMNKKGWLSGLSDEVSKIERRVQRASEYAIWKRKTRGRVLVSDPFFNQRLE